MKTKKCQSGCRKYMRTYLFAMNLTAFIFGCGLLGLGIWLHHVKPNFEALSPMRMYTTSDRSFITTGVIVIMLGFSGCCGSWFWNKPLLKLYLLLLICILMLECLGGLCGYIYRELISEFIQEDLLTGIKEYYTVNNSNGLHDAWDYLQTTFNCCGVVNYKDWYKVSAWPDQDRVPFSCCTPHYANVSTCGESGNEYMFFQAGCYGQFRYVFMQSIFEVSLGCLIIIMVQIYCFVCASLSLLYNEFKQGVPL